MSPGFTNDFKMFSLGFSAKQRPPGAVARQRTNQLNLLALILVLLLKNFGWSRNRGAKGEPATCSRLKEDLPGLINCEHPTKSLAILWHVDCRAHHDSTAPFPIGVSQHSDTATAVEHQREA